MPSGRRHRTYTRTTRGTGGEDSSIGASSDDGGAVWKDGGKKQPNGTNMKRSDSSTHGRWGKDDEARGEPCLNSRCCRRAFDEPAKVTGFLLLIAMVGVIVLSKKIDASGEESTKPRIAKS